jgi:PAS domain S-box-containing protein
MESDVRSGSSAKLVLQGEMIIACNNDALTLFRCDREALLGQSYLKFSAPTQPNGWRSADSLRLKETAAKAGQRQHFDWTCRRPDGLTFTARASLKRVKSRGKSYVQLTLKKAKESEPAEETLLKFRLGIERSNDAIFMTDIDGIIIFANPAFEKVYGYSVDEALGKTPRLLKSGVLGQEVYEDFWQTLLAKKVVAGEIINKTKDGNLIHIEGSNNPILDENGALIGFLSIHRDITERKQAEETFQNAQVELEQRVTERTSELARANVRLSEQFVEIQQVKEALERRNRILEALNELARQTTSSLLSTKWRGRLLLV